MNWLFIGLGNPGARYELTRHNTGFWMAEALAEYLGFSFRKPWFKSYQIADQASSPILTVKPLTYMNRSGQVIPGLQKKYRVPAERVVVLVDQMDLAPGQFRLKPKGSNAGHNGLKSMEFFLATKNYPRLYMGIGRPPGEESVIDHVLDPPFEEEGQAILRGVHKLAPLLAAIPDKGLENIMSEINAQFG